MVNVHLHFEKVIIAVGSNGGGHGYGSGRGHRRMESTKDDGKISTSATVSMSPAFLTKVDGT